MDDRNKNDLTNEVTSHARRWMLEIGCKPVETEVSLAKAWIADLAGIWLEKGWVSEESAKKLVDGWLKKFGVEVDPNETIEENKGEIDQKDGEDAYDNAPDASMMIYPNKK